MTEKLRARVSLPASFRLTLLLLWVVLVLGSFVNVLRAAVQP